MTRILTQIFLYILLTAGVVGVVYLSYAETGNALLFLVDALFFLLSLLLVPALHEAGHVAIGKACGMRLVALSVGFVYIEKHNGKTSFRFRSPFSEEAGECRMYPSDEKDIDKKFMLYSVGGVLFQLIYFVAAIIPLLLLQNYLLWATLGMTLPYCLYLFLLNAMPFTSGMGASDGEIFFGLWRKDPSQKTLVNLFTVQGYLSQGYTPSEVPKDLYFDLPQLPEDDGNFSLLQLWRYYYYLDKGQKKEAQNALCRLEDQTEYIPEGYLPTIYAELTYVYAVLNPDPAQAKHYYELMTHCGKSPTAQQYRASVAFARLTGREKDNERVKDDLFGMQKLEDRLLAEL
jgi:hypothetical protein